MNITVHKNGQQLGPFTEFQIGDMLASGQLEPADLGWAEGMAEWKPLSTFPALQSTSQSMPPPRPPTLAANKNEPLAIWSLVLGIISIVGCGMLAGIPAVICGHIGMSRIKRNSYLGGKGLATAGLITGYLSILITFLVLPALLLPAVNSAIDAAKKAQAKNDVTQIATAVVAYETEYGKMPPGATEAAADIEGTLLNALTGTSTTNNPRKIVFIEVAQAKNGKSGVDSITDPTKFLDPWGNTYKIVVDANYDNSVTVMGTTLRKKVAVWNEPSGAGSKGRAVTSWQ
jgi:hypothetical protein